MAKDYRRKRSTKKTASPARWLLSGFALGLVAAFALYLQMRPDVIADRPTPESTIEPLSAASPTEGAVNNEEPAEKPPSRSAETRSAPALPEPGDSQYDFYEVLPGFVVEVPESDAKTNSQPRQTAQRRQSDTPQTPSTYLLQAGSFQQHADADRRKAEIGLLGHASTITQVNVKGQNWFRVYVGPTQDKESLEYARSMLRRQGIDALLLRENKQ